MNIVTGQRRSGTSMLMYALKEAGLNVIGDKYYVENLEKKVYSTDEVKEMQKQTVESNPHGYWEVGKVTTEVGLSQDLTKMPEFEKGEVIKIMFEALPLSKPELIDKTLVIFRNPRKSLQSLFKINDIKLPELYIINSVLDITDSMQFLKDKEYKIVIYENILKAPVKEMKAICDFLGKGDYKKGAKAIKKKLDRSDELREQYNTTKYLDKIYELALSSDIDGMLSLVPEIEAEANVLIGKYDKIAKVS